MKKRLFERALVVVAACAVCVGVTSCGNDATDQPAPATPPAASPAPKASAAEPPAPAAPPVTAPEPEPAPAPSSTLPPSPPQVAEQASVVPADTDVKANIDRLSQVAQRQDADFLTPARAWAGDSLRRKLWVCAIAQRTGRVADLIVLAREARAACSGSEATFGNLYRVAQYFEAASAFNEAWDALDKAFARAREEKVPKERQEEAKKLWRRVSRAK